MKTLTAKLKALGYKENRHGDALDKDNNRVYFDDGLVVVVKFNNPRAQLIEAKSTIDSHLGDDVVLNVIDALTK